MVLIMKNFSWKIFGDTCEYGHISLGLAGPILWTLVARPQDIEKSKTRDAYPYAYGFGESKYWFAASRIFASNWVLRVEQLKWHNYELIKI